MSVEDAEIYDPDGGFQVLTEDSGMPLFLVKIGDDVEYSMKFEVFEVQSWECDEATPYHIEKYISGYVKWDGCADLDFHTDECLLHFCGKRGWERHCEMMMAVQALAARTITKYDRSLAE